MLIQKLVLLLSALQITCCSSGSELMAEVPSYTGKTLITYYNYTDNTNPNDASSYPAIDPMTSLSEYQNIIIDTPLWWSQMAAIMQTYLFNYGSQMTGKNIGLAQLNFAIAQTTMNKMYITIDGQTKSVTLVDNAATQKLIEKLQQAPVTVTLNSSGGFEIWGALGFSLPTNDQQTTAQPGDVILYNGSNICLFYGTNTWSYTRLGKIEGLSESELRTFLKAGESNISVTLSLTSNETAIRQIQNADDKTGDYYSINGQRVTKPSHGIYIKNGKKIIL